MTAAPSTAATSVSRPLAAWSQRPRAPVSTVQAFNDWFGVVTDAIEAESERRFHSYLEPVSRQLAICDATLSDLDDCRGLLREIEANWKFVDENAQSMERACEDMLKEQKHLDALASSTTERLDYFRRLEEAQRLLNLPGDAELVHRPEFLDMLDRLEICLEFMKSNVGTRSPVARPIVS